MDFIDKIKILSEKLLKVTEQLQTEEATKNALIMPFIQALGYDVFNPLEVVPEFTADVGTKKGEKVDYAIIKDGNPIILIECKHCSDKLDKHDSQLYRYFSVTKAKFAILTNGVIFKFFTDLDESNKMDQKPFLEINMLDIKENTVNELKKFCKESFDIDEIFSSAGELKYTKEIKLILNKELTSPSDDFVRLFTSQVYSGRITQNILEKFSEITKRAFNQFVNDLLNERLKSAIMPEVNSKEKKAIIEEVEITEDINSLDIITTQEELEGFYTIKAILRSVINTERVCYRDTKNYFNILMDNNKLKTICRLHLNTKQKYIGFIGEDKKEIRTPINTLDDIYRFAEQITEIARKFE